MGPAGIFTAMYGPPSDCKGKVLDEESLRQCDQRGLQVRRERNQLLLGDLLLQHLAVIAECHQVKGRLTKVNTNRFNLHAMILLEPAYKISRLEIKRRTTPETPY
jgi:hypothetical protein